LWREFPTVIPFAVIDPRLMDLALSFWNAPNDKIFEAYRRLEDTIRSRTGIKEKSGRLFSNAFMGDRAKLRWRGCDDAEQAARGELFRATFTAFRNPRAHGQVGGNAEDKLTEFLLANQLFRLEREAVLSRPRKPKRNRGNEADGSRRKPASER
jgi:hypothetical protein